MVGTKSGEMNLFVQWPCAITVTVVYKVLHGQRRQVFPGNHACIPRYYLDITSDWSGCRFQLDLFVAFTGVPEVSEGLVSQSNLWKLMGSYVVLGFIGFFLILLFLDRIGAKADPEFSGYQVSTVIWRLSCFHPCLFVCLARLHKTLWMDFGEIL